jgi:hypothetical protein
MVIKRTISHILNNTFSRKDYPWKSDINYRYQPDLYRVGKGEQGVLICEPYKSEILPHWKFKSTELAIESSARIFELFEDYLERDDFVGADLARKFLQMGFTRARRYANYKGGRKYDKEDHSILAKDTGEDEKARSAEIFYKFWQKAEHDEYYASAKKAWKNRLG